MNPAFDGRRISLGLLVIVLSLLLFAPTSYSHAYLRSADALSDFYQHMKWAISLQKHGADSIPAFVLAHSGWESLLVFLNDRFGISFNLAAFISALSFSVLAVFILFLWFYPSLLKTGKQIWVSVVIILGVSIAAPVSLLWPLDKLLYLGYVGNATYHSPTMLFLKPFAVLQFVYAYHCFSDTKPIKVWHMMAAAIVSLLSTFVKPSLAICILPALFILAAYRLLQKKYVNSAALIFGIGLPTILVLIWQFFVTYLAQESDGIQFVPFGVMGAFSNYLGLKFLLSILFPLAVLLFYFKQAMQDTRMILAWLIFVFGIIFTYFFAENSRFMEGNFAWSGEIAMVLLFMISTLFCLEAFPKSKLQKWTLSLLWSSHVAFGIVYYVTCVLNQPYY